jgi:mRNA interferase MazF
MEIKRGQIYYADLSPVVGSEQGGYRPVLIVQNDIGNKHSPTTIAAVITSIQTKHKLPTHINIQLVKDSVILLEQIRTIDKRRLKCLMETLDEDTMAVVDKAIKISLGV